MIVNLGNRPVGDNNPVYVIAEIGINHNGDINIAKKLIDKAVECGCDAVKFQKRTPELCVPEHQKNIIRETPWGNLTYLEYRNRLEFGFDEYKEIDGYCKKKNIHWCASLWDDKSLEFIEKFNPPYYKIPSALLANHELLKLCRNMDRPIILSTGMSTMDQIREAVSLLDKGKLLIAHCTSIYPSPLEQLNLRMIQTLKKDFDAVIGYSGHEVGLSPTYAAIALGAKFVERHITLDRAMWGSDHSASIEPVGLRRLVENIRNIEVALGNGVKSVYMEELVAMKRLRNTN